MQIKIYSLFSLWGIVWGNKGVVVQGRKEKSAAHIEGLRSQLWFVKVTVKASQSKRKGNMLLNRAAQIHTMKHKILWHKHLCVTALWPTFKTGFKDNNWRCACHICTDIVVLSFKTSAYQGPLVVPTSSPQQRESKTTNQQGTAMNVCDKNKKMQQTQKRWETATIHKTNSTTRINHWKKPNNC